VDLHLTTKFHEKYLKCNCGGSFKLFYTTKYKHYYKCYDCGFLLKWDHSRQEKSRYEIDGKLASAASLSGIYYAEYSRMCSLFEMRKMDEKTFLKY